MTFFKGKIAYIVFIVFHLGGSLLAQEKLDKQEDHSLNQVFEDMYRYGTFSKTDSIQNLLNRGNHSLDPSEEAVLRARILWKKTNKDWDSLVSFIRTTKEKATVQKSEYTSILDYLEIFGNYQIHLSKSRVERELFLYQEKYRDDNLANQLSLGQSYDLLGRIKQDKQQYDQSNRLLEKATQIFEKNNFKLSLAISYAILGANYNYLEDFENAALYYGQSIALNDELKEQNYDVLASTSFNLSLLYGESLGDLKRALLYAQKALGFDNKVSDENPYIALDLGRLSDIFYEQGRYSKSQIYAEQAVHHAKKNFKRAPSRIAESLRKLSQSYAILGEKEKAIKMANEAIQILEDEVPEKHRWTAANYLNLAKVYYLIGDDTKAKIHFQKVADIATSINRDLYNIEAYDKLARIALRNKNPDEAIAILNTQLELLERKFSNATLYHLENQLSQLKVHYLNGNFETSKKLLSNMVKEDNISFYPNIDLQLKGYAILLADKPSNKRYQDFMDAFISLRNTFPSQFDQIKYNNTVFPLITLLIEELSFRQKLSKEDISLLGQLMDINRNAVLLNGIQNVNLKKKSGIPQHLIAREFELLDSIVQVRRQLEILGQSDKVNEDKREKLLSKSIELTSTYESLSNKLREDYPSFANSKNIWRKKNLLSEVQSKLKSGQAIIQYFTTRDALVILIVDSNELKIKRIPLPDNFKADVSELLLSITGRKFNSVLSQKLNKVLLPELPKNIDELIFVTDGVLSFLPFEVLMDHEGYLIQKFAVSYCGSLQMFLEQNKLSRNISLNSWAGFAPYYKTNSLSSNENEVAIIQRITKGKTYIGDKATKSRFLSQNGNYNILHIAAHTNLKDADPMEAKILFGENNTEEELTAGEVYALQIKANLAVLSACESGFGKVESGEGVMSMSRAFTYAGVGSTLMTLWKIPDKESSNVTSLFYEHLSQGMPKNKALQAGKQRYLDTTSDSMLKEPYYWAGFVLTGDISPLEKEMNSWYYVLTGLIVVLAVILARRRFSKN